MKWLLAMQLTAWAAFVAIGGELPRVWMSTSFMKDLDVFEKAVKDCHAHGVDVMDNGPTPNAKVCAERLSICRAHGMKLHVGVSDASKNEMLAKKTGRYELAAMSGGCYRGLAIDRNLFSFTAAKHEIIVEPPVYSKGQAYAKHPHYYMIGDGHYFGGYVPTGGAEVVVPERPFDGKQHLRIVPAKVETTPADAVRRWLRRRHGGDPGVAGRRRKLCISVASSEVLQNLKNAYDCRDPGVGEPRGA